MCYFRTCIQSSTILVLDQINIQYYSIPESMNIEIGNDSIQTFVVLPESDWTDQTKDLLLKMLKAVKLEDSQFQIIQIPEASSVKSETLIHLSSGCKILAFGLTPTDLHMNIRAALYEMTPLEQASFVFSDSLSTLIQKPGLKKPLWTALQTLFS